MQRLTSTRTGRYIRQPSGYAAYVPSELPPDPPIEPGALTQVLSGANLAIGRLDGVGRTLPNPDLFVAMYVRREAVLSSQIEGTQSTLDDVLAYELDARAARLPGDVSEVVNHVAAMKYGLERLATIPLSLRLIREIHGVLMKGVRGDRMDPGAFRRSQNWIGPRGGSLADAAFVPPPIAELDRLLGNFEKSAVNGVGQPGALLRLVASAVWYAPASLGHRPVRDQSRCPYVEPLRPDQQRAATLTLAEAFASDPLLEILAPDPVRRVKLGLPMMGVLLSYGLRYGQVWSNDDASAVAIWLPPESGPMTMPKMLRAGMWRAPFMLGLDGLGRMSKAMSATEGFHKQVEGPHWYLMTVGTRTARQGQGLGSQLVEMGTSRADAAGVPCYLETGTDSNIAFYRKRGFEIVGQADCYGYTLTGMVRTPR